MEALGKIRVWVEAIAANGIHAALCRSVKHYAHGIAPTSGCEVKHLIIRVPVSCTIVIHNATTSEVVLLFQNTREVTMKLLKTHG